MKRCLWIRGIEIDLNRLMNSFNRSFSVLNIISGSINLAFWLIRLYTWLNVYCLITFYALTLLFEVLNCSFLSSFFLISSDWYLFLSIVTIAISNNFWIINLTSESLGNTRLMLISITLIIWLYFWRTNLNYLAICRICVINQIF